MDENREYQIFENYIKSVCRKIMSQKKKYEVREELYSHLLEEYERNSALGMDSETAQSAAIEKMGDENKIANNFGELYSINPPHYIKSAFNILIAGIFFTIFEFNFLPEGMPELLKFIATALMIYSLAKLRKSEKQFNKAMWLVVITHIATTISNLITMYIPRYEKITIWPFIISCALKDLLYWWIFSGIEFLCEKNKYNDDKKPRTLLGFCMWILYTIAYFIGYIYEYPEFVYIAIIPILVMFYQLNKAKKYLSNAEPEFNLEKPLVKLEKLVCIILIFVIAITPIFVMIGVSNIDPKTNIYSPADTEATQEEIIYARNHLADLGLPQNHINDLPDSEVLRYTYSTHMQNEYRHHKLLNDMEEKTAMYFFYFPDHTVRILMYVELSNDLKTNHRNGLYIMFRDGFIAINNNASENYTDSYGKFFLALSEKNGKTYSSDYFSEYAKENMSHRISGNEFSFPDDNENRRAYLAYTAAITYYGIEQKIYINGVYYYQRIPVRAEWKSFNEMADFNLINGITTYSYKTPVYARNLGWGISFNPKYCEE